MDKHPCVTCPFQNRGEPAFRVRKIPRGRSMKRTKNPADGTRRLDLDVGEPKFREVFYLPFKKDLELVGAMEPLRGSRAESRASRISVREYSGDICPVPVPYQEVKGIEHLEAGLMTRVHMK